MLTRNSKQPEKTAVQRAIRRTFAVVACVAGVAGCENLADLGKELQGSINRAFTTPEKPLGTEPVPAPNAAKNKPAVAVLDRSAVRRLQVRLGKLGYRPGPPDGIIGSRTIRAIKSYQTAFGLTVTDDISSDFLDHLEEMTGKGAAAAQPPGSTGSTASLVSDDFPTYLPGTSFIYSDGDSERVVGEKDLVVRWVRGDGTTYSAHRNFLLPKAYWASDEERGTATVSGSPDALWPAREGAKVSFSAKVTMQRGDDPESTRRWIDQWTCRNDGRREVTVQAGTFDTAVLVCRREGNSDAPAIERTWYYANDVRHYVRFVESNPEDDTTKIADLVAVRPGAPDWPPIVRAALTRALVHALEMQGSSSQMPWTSSGVNTHVTIEAKARFVTHDGRPCRRFVQIWSENGVRRQYPAVACKSTAGKWTIPTLEGAAADSLATAGGLS